MMQSFIMFQIQKNCSDKKWNLFHIKAHIRPEIINIFVNIFQSVIFPIQICNIFQIYQHYWI